MDKIILDDLILLLGYVGYFPRENIIIRETTDDLIKTKVYEGDKKFNISFYTSLLGFIA